MQKTILVTGATKGIGLATAEWLTRHKHQVIGIARNASQTFPGKLFLCDLSDAEQTQEVLGQIAKDYSIDAVVNNVGTNIPQALEEIDLQTYQMIMDVNLRSALQVAQTFCTGMKERQWGRIVNIASRAIFGSRNRTVYSAAKSALVDCTLRGLLSLPHLASRSMLLHQVQLKQSFFGKPDLRVALRKKRSWLGLPSEVASLIGFLLSEDSGYITGQTICIDGGGSL